jgi:ABC-type transport system involved in cytochrome c biogenesis permease subunit
VLVTKAAFASAGSLLGRPKRQTSHGAAHGLASAGFAFMTIGLVLGAWWGKLAWGDWWNWDPKEMWSLASWLVLAGYFQLRLLRPEGFRRLRAAVLMLVLLLVLITLTWANLSRTFSGLHSYT